MTTTELVVTLIVAILGSSGLGTVASILITRHYQKKDERAEEKSEEIREIRDTLDVLKKSVEAMAHDAFFKDCDTLLPKDTITKEELENHNYLYRAYHSLNLNSTGDRMHELILEKPVQKK